MDGDTPSNQRIAMHLMRHSDLKLTAKVYTDELLLPVSEAVKRLPRLKIEAPALAFSPPVMAPETGNGCQTVSRVGANWRGSEQSQLLENQGENEDLSPLEAYIKMERVKRFELSTSTLARLRSTN